MTDRPTNWAGNVLFGAARLHHPTSLDEVRRIVASSEKVRAIGSGHSFNPIADTVGDQDLSRRHATVAAHRCRALDGDGRGRRPVWRTCPATPSSGLRAAQPRARCRTSASPERRATGTHGSGVTNGNLATAVRALGAGDSER